MPQVPGAEIKHRAQRLREKGADAMRQWLAGHHHFLDALVAMTPATAREAGSATGLSVADSEGNFVLPDFGSVEKAEAANEFLKSSGIIVRGVRGYGRSSVENTGRRLDCPLNRW